METKNTLKEKQYILKELGKVHIPTLYASPFFLRLSVISEVVWDFKDITERLRVPLSRLEGP